LVERFSKIVNSVRVHPGGEKMWFLILSLVFPAYGAQCRHSSKRLACVEYVNNYDGDTMTFTIPRVFPLFGQHVRVRVAGIDAPEISSTKKCERELAEKVKKKVRDMLTHAKRIDLVNPKRDKYFRILADVVADGVSIGETLLEKGWAISYHGEAKSDYNWCKQKTQTKDFMPFTMPTSNLPYDPYQGQWKYSGDLEPAIHAHNVKLYLINEEAKKVLRQYISEGYVCEKRLGVTVLCRKLLDEVEIPQDVRDKMNQRANQMSVRFESYDGGGTLITDGQSYREWNVPSVVFVNEEKYEAYVFSKSSSGLIKILMGYEDKQQTRHSFVATREALKYYTSVVVENKNEWHEYSAFAVFHSQLTE